MIQTGYFKWTKRRFGQGRRVFKMAPLHHHFELMGWSETQVMQRFVLIGTVAAMLGISLALTYTTTGTNTPPQTQSLGAQTELVVQPGAIQSDGRR